MLRYFVLIFFIVSPPIVAQTVDIEERASLAPFNLPQSDDLEGEAEVITTVPVDADEDIEERSQILDALEQAAEDDPETDNEDSTNPEWIPRTSIVIKGLDKVTARVFSANVFINQKIRFGTLEIYVRAIFEKPPEDTPEKISFIEIYDTPPGKKQDLVFSGWMFASNPALSALEHPVYDIWVEQS